MIRLKNCLLGLCALLAAGAMSSRAHATTISGALTLDNAFYAYISTSNSTLGTLVASGNDWGQTFSFSNFVLNPGNTYYLHVEGINYGGPGAFLGQFTLSDSNFAFANGSQTLLTGGAGWTAGYNDSNSNPGAVQPWVVPTGGFYTEGVNGVSPWGPHPLISASAQWMWPSDANSNGCGFCTVDFSAVIAPTTGVPAPGALALLGFGLAGIGAARRRKLL